MTLHFLHWGVYSAVLVFGAPRLAVLHNPTDRAVETDLPLAEAGSRLTIYEDRSEGGWGKAKRALEAGDPGASLRSAPATQSRRVRLEPDRHLVVVATRGQ
jgi:hypothetical protein